MAMLLYVWLVLVVSISAIIRSNPFALRASRVHRCGSSYCRYPSHFRNMLSPSAFRVKITSYRDTPSVTALRSNGDIGSISPGIDIESDDDIDGARCNDEIDYPFALYIHIPYCRQRCRYCDFAIVPIGDNESTKKGRDDTFDSDTVGENNDQYDSDGSSSQQSRRQQGFHRMNDRYVSAIVAELKQIAARNTDLNKKCQKVPLRSIYFGGGTPSLAPIESIESIIHHACGRDNPNAPFRLLQQSQPMYEEVVEGLNIGNNIVETEITMEMDPGTFDREYLSSLRGLGINRVSLGVQSFDDDLLCAMGRTHRRADVLQAIRDIAFVFGSNQKDNKIDDNGWDKVNYSIDLISGCPGLTLAKWVETLQEATAGVESKQRVLTKNTGDSLSAAMKDKRPLLLSSLPPPKHISVYDMQIEDGTVFGNWAAKAKEAAVAKRDEDGLSNGSYENDEDGDEDPSRQFTVALPIDHHGKAGGNISRGSDPKEKPSQEQRILRLPSEDECAFMYKYAAGYLRAKNYEHYEVSSYAAFSDPAKCRVKSSDGEDDNHKKQHVVPMSKRSKHNQIYWEYDGQWYAIGLGATSFVDKNLVARPREMNDYIQWVHSGNEYMSSTVDEVGEKKDKSANEDFLSDLLLKRLRTIDGLDLSWLEANYGSEIVKEVLEGAKLGLDLELAEHSDDNVLRLTDPEG